MLLDNFISNEDSGQTEGANYFNTSNFHMFPQLPEREYTLGEGERQVRDSVMITKSSLSKTDLSATSPLVNSGNT